MSTRPALEALGARSGIVPAYHDLGGVLRVASDETREALLAAMGHDGSSEASARRSLDGLDARRAQRWLDPVRVWRTHAAQLPRVSLRPGPGCWNMRLALQREDGSLIECKRQVVAGSDGTVSVALPERPAPGVHRLSIDLGDGRASEQSFIAAPRTAPLFHERLGGRRVFGVTANLYSLRGEGGLGYGDLGDLRRLQELVASWGGDFVALNPLHALRNRGEDISPYSPVSRLWRNLLYLDIEAIPEFAGCARARDLLESPQAAESVRELRAAERLDQEAVLELKLKLLRELHRSFAGRERSSGSERGRAYAQFLDDGSTALVDFATFETLATLRKEGPDWRLWPESLRDPRGAAVLAFRREHSEAVDLHCWIQFELERQLEEAARAGRDAGLALGLIGDLAVGTPAHSADAWANKHLFARGVSLGAPPDAFSTEGQNWGLAPLDPNRLAEDGFSFWTRLVRASLRHAGGLRIDHAIGLQRSFWIPDGRPGSEGAYVLQPTEELLGILALEAQRSAALLIGEDLGVVPVDLGRRLASWGVLSTRVLLFERDGPTFRAPRTYSPRAFVSATTHDLVPLAGYVDGSDLSLRAPLEGQDEAALEHSLAGRRDDLGHLERALDEAGVPPGEFAERLHRFLAPCPAALLALCLDDVAGEREPINLPGISTARHRSWSRRMTRPLESFVLDREVVGPRARVIAPGT